MCHCRSCRPCVCLLARRWLQMPILPNYHAIFARTCWILCSICLWRMIMAWNCYQADVPPILKYMALDAWTKYNRKWRYDVFSSSYETRNRIMWSWFFLGMRANLSFFIMAFLPWWGTWGPLSSTVRVGHIQDVVRETISTRGSDCNGPRLASTLRWTISAECILPAFL